LLKDEWSDTFWINSPTNPKKEVIMTTQEKLVNRKLSIIELADLQNFSRTFLKPAALTAFPANTSMTSKKSTMSMVSTGLLHHS
jgi:hypothetical protein